jgi:hypothetical protein
MERSREYMTLALFPGRDSLDGISFSIALVLVKFLDVFPGNSLKMSGGEGGSKKGKKVDAGEAARGKSMNQASLMGAKSYSWMGGAASDPTAIIPRKRAATELVPGLVEVAKQREPLPKLRLKRNLKDCS